MTSLDPALFPRRVLLATIGLAPQIVTETLYALCVEQNPPFIPDEVHVLTTAEGAHRVRQTLLEPSQAHLAKFAEEYGLPSLALALTLERIHVIADAAGNSLPDISTQDGNAFAANLTVEVVQTLTADPEAALHVSIAGGRKTMGFLLGSAMTIFGRPQDRLSHVLVEPQPLELHPEFFYKPKEARVLYDVRDKNRPINTADAKITLADIRFVRLREGLPQPLLDGTWSYSETVDRAQEAFSPRLVLDPKSQRISCGRRVFKVSAMQFALYEIIARTRAAAPDQDAFVHWSGIDGDDFIEGFKALPNVTIRELKPLRDAFANIGKPGFEGDNDPRKKKFEQAKTRMNGRLEKQLGPYFGPYEIKQQTAANGQKLWGLDVPPEAIAFAAIEAAEDIEEDVE